jgi:hypothetical protein
VTRRSAKTSQFIGLASVVLQEKVESAQSAAAISVMRLESHFIAVMACDDEAVPLQGMTDEAYITQRHPMDVACTRVRDQFSASGAQPPSEFLGVIR